MNILVLGWYYYSNLGDAVLTDCTAQLLRQKYLDANIVVRDLIGRQDFSRSGNATLRGRLFRLLARSAFSGRVSAVTSGECTVDAAAKALECLHRARAESLT